MYVVFTYVGQIVPFFSKCVTFFPWRQANFTTNSPELKTCEKIFLQLRDNFPPLAFQLFSAVTGLTMVCPQIFDNPKFWSQPT
jgi:hypothetical protein